MKTKRIQKFDEKEGFKMKRIRLVISLILVFTMVSSFAAYGENKPASPNKVSGIVSSTTQKAPVVKIKESKTIKVAVKKAQVKKAPVKKVVKPVVKKHIPTLAEISKLPVDLSDLYKIKDGLMDGKTFKDQHELMTTFLSFPVSLTARVTYNTDANGLNALMISIAQDYMSKTLNTDYRKGKTSLVNDVKALLSSDNIFYYPRDVQKEVESKVISEGFFATNSDLTYRGSGAFVRGKVRIIYHSAMDSYLNSIYGINLKLNQWYEIPYEVDVRQDDADPLRHFNVAGINILKNYIKEINTKAK